MLHRRGAVGAPRGYAVHFLDALQFKPTMLADMAIQGSAAYLQTLLCVKKMKNVCV